MNLSEISIALKAKYPPPQYATLFEVRNQTGYGNGTIRYADAIVMDLYPSSGMNMSGFEFKMSRQDFINELQNPGKHKKIADHCNSWWLIVGDKDIIKEGELPDSWGLMIPRGDKLIIKKHAPIKQVENIPRSFLSSLLRSALNVSPGEALIKAVVNEAVRVDRDKRKLDIGMQLEKEKAPYAYLKESIDKFEERSGIKITSFNGPQMGAAVKFVMQGGLKGLSNKMIDIKRIADQISIMANNATQINETFIY